MLMATFQASLKTLSTAQAMNVYRRLEELLPPLRDSLEKKIANAQEHFAPEKN